MSEEIKVGDRFEWVLDGGDARGIWVVTALSGRACTIRHDGDGFETRGYDAGFLAEPHRYRRLPREPRVGDIVKDPALLRPGMRLRPPKEWSFQDFTVGERNDARGRWELADPHGYYLTDESTRKGVLTILALPEEAPKAEPVKDAVMARPEGLGGTPATTTVNGLTVTEEQIYKDMMMRDEMAAKARKPQTIRYGLEPGMNGMGNLGCMMSGGRR